MMAVIIKMEGFSAVKKQALSLAFWYYIIDGASNSAKHRLRALHLGIA